MAWLKNTDGNQSASFTMMIVAYAVVTLWLLLSIATKLGPVTIRPFSGTEAMAYLTPILALYWGRRQQETTMKLQQPMAFATPAAVVPTVQDVGEKNTCGCECECCKSCETCQAE